VTKENSYRVEDYKGPPRADEAKWFLTHFLSHMLAATDLEVPFQKTTLAFLTSVDVGSLHDVQALNGHSP
jgi:hypothetical protein